jgi:hypothetical protein
LPESQRFSAVLGEWPRRVLIRRCHAETSFTSRAKWRRVRVARSMQC